MRRSYAPIFLDGRKNRIETNKKNIDSFKAKVVETVKSQHGHETVNIKATTVKTSDAWKARLLQLCLSKGWSQEPLASEESTACIVW